jgi:hypothetical protein
MTLSPDGTVTVGGVASGKVVRRGEAGAGAWAVEATRTKALHDLGFGGYPDTGDPRDSKVRVQLFGCPTFLLNLELDENTGELRPSGVAVHDDGTVWAEGRLIGRFDGLSRRSRILALALVASALAGQRLHWLARFANGTPGAACS